MADNIEQDGVDDTDKKRLLFEKITHRGPAAFNKLLDILKENGHDEVHQLLTLTLPSKCFSRDELDEPSQRINSGPNQLNSNGPMDNSGQIVPPPNSNINNNNSPIFPPPNNSNKLEPFIDLTSYKFDPTAAVKPAQSFGSDSLIPVYKMRSAKRGVFFFVNIINYIDKRKTRKGAEKDKENLVTLFRELGYLVFYFEDRTQPQFNSLMKQLLASDYLKDIDSFVFCLHTHGNMVDTDTIMKFYDGTWTTVEKIVGLFSNEKCKDLAGKPKVFLFPFCRGDELDFVSYQHTAVEPDGPDDVSTFSDILICYATVPSFETSRSVFLGSWYVQDLCQIFVNHACDTHVEDMMKMISTLAMKRRSGDDRVQVASTQNCRLNKLMFLNPKISET